MENTQKAILFWVGTILMVTLIGFVVISTDQKLNTATTTSTVSFTGEGKVLAKPDVATVDLSIVTEAPTSKDAQDANNAKSKTLTDFLKGQSIDDKDIKTTSYTIYPQYDYPRYNAPVIRGYQVNQTMQVKIRKLADVSNVLDGVISSGVNQINNLRFEIDNPDAIKAEARANAIAQAKKKAGELKSQLGVRLGRLVNFSESMNGFPPPIFYEAAKAGYGMGGGGPSVPTGENEITVDVTLTYQIR